MVVGGGIVQSNRYLSCPYLYRRSVVWRIFVQLALGLSSRPPRNLFGGMDELDAAASVLAMEVDSDAEEDQELGAAPGESSDDIGLRTFSEPSSENKENHIDQPASAVAERLGQRKIR